jgi:hypothetical protein
VRPELKVTRDRKVNKGFRAPKVLLGLQAQQERRATRAQQVPKESKGRKVIPVRQALRGFKE